MSFATWIFSEFSEATQNNPILQDCLSLKQRDAVLKQFAFYSFHGVYIEMTLTPSHQNKYFMTCFSSLTSL